MEQRFTQSSPFIIIALFLTIAFCIIMVTITDYDVLSLYILLSVSLLMIVVLLLFYKMTIVIDNSKITFFLGIGLIRKSYYFSEIESIQCVNISPIMDVGIKILRNGWLYSVSGKKAIELSFKNRKTIVQIGTKDCEEIYRIISLML